MKTSLIIRALLIVKAFTKQSLSLYKACFQARKLVKRALKKYSRFQIQNYLKSSLEVIIQDSFIHNCLELHNVICPLRNINLGCRFLTGD